MRSGYSKQRRNNSGGAPIGRIHSVESCGTVDGPGIRFIVFTAGCPLRCQYCHNPDALDLYAGDPRDVDSLVTEIGHYADFVARAHGGLTVSGGEPLVQPEFVGALLRGVKDAFGMHTAIDTSGHGTPDAAAQVLPYTDLVLLDVKSWIPDVYQKVTGQPIDSCLRFAALLEQAQKPTWIRFVLVPGVTDSEENLEGLAQYLRTLTCVERIEVLPFHKMGEYKWQELGISYQLTGIEPPSPEQIQQAVTILKKSGHRVVV